MTLDLLLRDEWRRDAVHAAHGRLKRGLLALGYHDDVAASDRQILSVVTGDGKRTASFRDACARRGVFGSVWCPPAAREGRNYVRFTVHCGMGEAECDRFLQVMEDVRPALRRPNWL